MDLVEGVRQGNRLALARMLTQVENDTPLGREGLNRLFPFTGKAHLIGITGSPGTGKSSLACRLAKAFRALPEQPKVAIIAIDPTSPFSGGALLGDRVRMRDLSGDGGVFIRSMASRGALGGLARTTSSVAQVLDSAGYGLIFIETVGAGQSEVDIARLAHTVLVVEAPGLGDDIQAIKAGILEIADILVVNKADLAGADQTMRVLRSMIDLGYPSRLLRGCNPRAEDAHGVMVEEALPPWEPPVLQTVSASGQGVDEVVHAIQQHRDYLLQSNQWRQRDADRLQNGLDVLLQATLVARLRASLPTQAYEQILNQMSDRQLSPFEAVAHLMELSSVVQKK